MIPILIVIIIGLAILAFSLHLRVENGKKALAATNAYCDADEQLIGWLHEHQKENMSHPLAQKLLRELILTYLNFLETHPYLKIENEKKHLEFLLRLQTTEDLFVASKAAVFLTERIGEEIYEIA